MGIRDKRGEGVIFRNHSLALKPPLPRRIATPRTPEKSCQQPPSLDSSNLGPHSILLLLEPRPPEDDPQPRRGFGAGPGAPGRGPGGGGGAQEAGQGRRRGGRRAERGERRRRRRRRFSSKFFDFRRIATSRFFTFFKLFGLPGTSSWPRLDPRTPEKSCQQPPSIDRSILLEPRRSIDPPRTSILDRSSFSSIRVPRRMIPPRIPSPREGERGAQKIETSILDRSSFSSILLLLEASTRASTRDVFRR